MRAAVLSSLGIRWLWSSESRDSVDGLKRLSVHRFHNTVAYAADVEVGEQLVAPTIDGGGQAGDLGDLDLSGPVEELLELEAA